MDESRNFMLEAYEQAQATIANTVNELGEKALEQAYKPNKVDTVDPSEALGKLAYEAYCRSKYKRLSEVVPWDMQPPFWKQNWIDAAEAVKMQVKEQDNG